MKSLLLAEGGTRGRKKKGRVKRSSESDDEKTLSSHVGGLSRAARKIGPVWSSRVQGFPGVPEC